MATANTGRKSLACVTMVYNEPDMLPLWLHHYGRQVGLDACYVLDHGSDDGSTSALGDVHHLRLARSPLDEPSRAAFVAKVCNALLHRYDYVAYTDADELLVADPARWTTLLDYVNATSTRAPVTTALGINLLHRMHRMHREVECDLARPILPQRAWGFPLGSMCKPTLIRAPVTWAPGFHASTAPVAFDGLFLFHLAFFDYDTAMRRQRKRRSHTVIDANTNRHHQVQDAEVLRWMEGWSGMPPDETVTLDTTCAASANFMQRIVESVYREPSGIHRFDLNLNPNRLWRIPARFANAF